MVIAKKEVYVLSRGRPVCNGMKAPHGVTPLYLHIEVGQKASSYVRVKG